MAFFDDLGKKISSTSQNVKNKAKGFVDITGPVSYTHLF